MSYLPRRFQLLAQVAQRVALHHESHVQQGENAERQEPRGQHAARKLGPARLQHDRHGMERRKHVDAQVDEGHLEHPADAEDSGVAGAHRGIGDGAPQQQVADVEEEEKQGQGQSRVPRPPRPPDWLSPDRSGRQHDDAEDRAHLGRCRREPVEPRVLREEVKDAREADEDHRRFGPDGRRHVEVEDLLREALCLFDGRVGQRPYVDAREQHEADSGEPASHLQHSHSFTVAGKRNTASVTKTMSYTASMLSQPTISFKGRPANRRPVASTAQLSGGIMNGNSNTGSSSSAKRVRVVIALNSVPTATNPIVASAISARSGPRYGSTRTLKNSASKGTPISSTPATKTRFAISLPR